MKRMSEPMLIALLSLLVGTMPISTDLYLPALPTLKLDLNASMSQAQLTLTGMLLAFGVSQLFWGPLSDRWGRRPVLLCGLSAFTLAAVFCTLAPSIEQLILWRTLQGAAMGSVVMCARAIVRDSFSPAEGARLMSKAFTGLGFILCLSAPLGGWLAAYSGWRSALVVLVIYGALTCAMVWGQFQESLHTPDPTALQWRVLSGNWVRFLSNPSFRAYTLLSMCTYGYLFTYLASSSFVFIHVMGLSNLQYGLILFCSTSSYIVGTWVCRRWLARWGLRKTIWVAGGMTLTGGISLFICAHFPATGVPGLILPFMLIMLAHGVHQPIGQTGAVGPFPDAAGAASAMGGFLMMLVAFGCGTWLGHTMDGTVFPMANGILFWCVAVAFVAWVLIQKDKTLDGQ